ncbi:MAG: hypothetical protein KKC05_04200, partial [Nanoarchaeota archaeon]|nr:hypothetical protein [Nanoarchaeota archaeon]
VGKEYLDGFRDGWSKKDLFADLIGIAISELNRRSDSFKLFFDYKTPESGDGNIMLKLYYTF